MADIIDSVLERLRVLIGENRYESLETDALEIKPVPSDTGSWRERHKSINAFLNTRGGILLLGLKEEQGPPKRWTFTGWRPDSEEKIKELPRLFTNQNGASLDLDEAFREMQLRPFLDGQVAVVYVDELPADRKFVFYRGNAWKRVLTGDHRISESEIESQREYIEELWHARELQPIPGAALAELDLDPLNDYIQQLNRPVRIETIKPDLTSAQGFLTRKGFIKDGQVTTLGMLVCGKHPEDHLGFRCHVHGYVDVPQKVAQDKQDLIGNLLPLMEKSLAYILRNIQVGVSIEGGGKAAPQYPEEVLRETVNNALAHRDYSINKQAMLSVKPGQHVSIRNPGAFRRNLLLEFPDDPIPLRRIIPEAKARNPKLADVLRVYRKWEGKGIGMATLVNLCLENRIDIPTYRLYTEEVCLFLKAGSLFGEKMKTHLAGFDSYTEKKLGGALTETQNWVLAYLIKAEWENRRHHYTILFTPDNNHFDQLLELERAGLIFKHDRSTTNQTVYMVDRVLTQEDYRTELAEFFSCDLTTLEPIARRCLEIIYRHLNYSRTKQVTAKMAAFALWYAERGETQNIKKFDAFYRKVRNVFNKLEKSMFIVRFKEGRRGFVLNEDFKTNHLL